MSQLPNIAKGTPVSYYSTKQGKSLTGKFSHWTPLNEAYIKEDGSNKPVWRKPGKFTIIGEAQTVFETSSNVVISESTANKKFDVNQRFDFLSSLARMVIKGTSKALVVTGEGGLGKTHTILNELEANPNMEEGVNYIVIKGYSTAKGLYKTLYENSDKLVVYDDTDEVLNNPTAINLIAAATDSYEKRIIHWISAGSFTGGDDELPSYFEFTGRMIFISNKSKTQVPQKLLSRSQNIDLTLSIEDKVKRMKYILPFVKKEVPILQREEALSVIEEYKTECRDLNMRTLLKVIEIRTGEDHEDWKSLAEFTVLS